MTSPCSIVVTGTSAWTCFGRGISPLLEAIRDARSGLAPVEGMPLDDPFFPSREAMQIRPRPEIASRFDGSSRSVPPGAWPVEWAVETALDAVVDAGHPQRTYESHRVAICAGTSHGANHGLLDYLQQTLDGEVPDPALLAQSAAFVPRTLAVRLGARGPSLSFNTACSSGLNAIGQGMRLLQAGRVDCVIAGGHDSFSYLSFTGFCSLKAIDPTGCKPFDVDRAGLSLGDGAAWVVLERAEAARARGATIRGRLTGYGCAGEGYHPTAPDPEGRGARLVMEAALASEPAPAELAFVSAHGTGTPANDGAEVHAIAAVAERYAVTGPVDVVSMKGQVGHSLGAAGAVQAVAALACMAEGLVPANVGLRTPIDAPPTLRFPTRPRARSIPLALCNAFGFGGSVASLAIRAGSTDHTEVRS